MKKTHRLPHTPLTVDPSTEPGSQQLSRLRDRTAVSRNRVRAGPRALLTGPSPTPRLLLLLFTPESHPGDTWLQCGPSPPERHAPHMLLGSQQGLTAFSGVK